MPPLYAGISPYRHALPATLFELTAVSPAPVTAPAPATGEGTAVPDSGPNAAADARTPARPAALHALAAPLVGRPLSVLVFLLAVFLWAVAYWQTWEALSMTERCRAVWQMFSGARGESPAPIPPPGTYQMRGPPRRRWPLSPGLIGREASVHPGTPERLLARRDLLGPIAEQSEVTIVCTWSS